MKLKSDLLTHSRDGTFAVKATSAQGHFEHFSVLANDFK